MRSLKGIPESNDEIPEVIANWELHDNKSKNLIEGEDYISLSNAMWEVWKRFIPSVLSFVAEYEVMLSNILFISLFDNSVLLSRWGLGN